MKLFKLRAGESFIEVIVAVVVIGMTVIIALNLLLNATSNTSSNRNFLLADNLALEGIEAVSTMISTNILKHGVENANTCWLAYATDTNNALFTADKCAQNKIVQPGQATESFLMRGYAIPDLHWDLNRNTNQAIDLENLANNTPFRLYRATLPPPLDVNYYYTNEISNNTPSLFYRSVKLALDAGGTRVTATVNVAWKEDGRVRHIEKTASLTNTNFTEQ